MFAAVILIVIKVVFALVFVAVFVFMFVTVAAMIPVIVSVRVIMCMIGGLGQLIILFKGFIMPVFVSATVSAMFRIERTVNSSGVDAQAMEHIHQHWIMGKLQMVPGNFYGDMPVTQMIGGAKQIQRRVCCHPDQIFVLCMNGDQSAIISDEYVAWQEQLATLDDHVHSLAIIQNQLLSAASTLIKRQVRARGVLP